MSKTHTRSERLIFKNADKDPTKVVHNLTTIARCAVQIAVDRDNAPHLHLPFLELPWLLGCRTYLSILDLAHPPTWRSSVTGISPIPKSLVALYQR